MKTVSSNRGCNCRKSFNPPKTLQFYFGT